MKKILSITFTPVLVFCLALLIVALVSVVPKITSSHTGLPEKSELSDCINLRY